MVDLRVGNLPYLPQEHDLHRRLKYAIEGLEYFEFNLRRGGHERAYNREQNARLRKTKNQTPQT